MLRFHFAARSDVGAVRELNEDSGLASERLLVVADGLGGHAAGELASSTAISVISALQLEGLTPNQATKKLTSTTKELSRKLLEQAGNYAERSGLGTTLSLVYLTQKPEILVFHIGDSRVYRKRGGDFEQVTKDHTYVQDLIDLGEITQEQAQTHPQRSLLTQAIDGITPANGDFSVMTVAPGDKFLVCTDGLTTVLSAPTLQQVLDELEPAAAASKLVDLALDRGAPDNVTVIVAEVLHENGAKPSDPIVVGAAAIKGNRDNLASLKFPRDQVPVLNSPDANDELRGSGPEGRSTTELGRHRIRLVVLTALITLGFALLGIYAALLNTQLFVGVENGKVALFRGIPQSITFVELNRPLLTSDLDIADLPSFEQQQVSGGISVLNEESGKELIGQLETRFASAK